MRKITSILLLSWAPFLLFGQWIQLNSGTAQHLKDIHFLNPAYGVAVGDNGTVLLTLDSGQQWNAIADGLSTNFSSVLVWNVDTILIAGKDESTPTTYLTTDAGQEWTLVDDGFEVERIGDRLLGIGYNTFRKSDTQGQVWEQGAGIIGNTTLPEQIKVADDQHAVVTGNVSGFFGYSFYGYRTKDQGDSWFPFYVFDLPNADAATASSYPHPDTLFVFTNEQDGFLPGPNNGLFRLTDFYFETANGVDSWRFNASLINSQIPTYVYDAAFVDGQKGYMVGENGQIYVTTDAGQNWDSVFDSGVSLNRIYLLANQMAFIVGNEGTILKNENLTSTHYPTRLIDIVLWPNPTHGELQIKGVDLPATNMYLFDVTGRLIRQFNWRQSESISLDGLPQGVYELAIKLKWQQLMFKIVKI